MSAERCIHEMESGCTICKNGPTPRGDSSTSVCRACEEPILWCVSEKGKKMPIDVEPSADGRFRKERKEANGDKVVRFVRDNEMEENTARLYTCHFDTCVERKKP